MSSGDLAENLVRTGSLSGLFARTPSLLNRLAYPAACLLGVTVVLAGEQPSTEVGAKRAIERVWLSQLSWDRLVVCCQTARPERVRLRAWREGEPASTGETPAPQILHHIEIPFKDTGAPLRYELSVSGMAAHSGQLRASPTDSYRVAVVADWGFATSRDLSALARDRPHLLVTAGDNVPDQHTLNGVGAKDGIRSYTALIDAHRELFNSIPFLPALGNHDHEIRPRGPKPPAEPVYDVEASAFRRFFALPEPEWCWRFDFPAFGVRLLALDLHHTSDYGTTWQSCHDFAPGSEQSRWFEKNASEPGAVHIVALQNERNATMRIKPRWSELFGRCSAVVTGFGYFAECAEPGARPLYVNTSLSGEGAQYPDPASKFLAGEDNYVLLTLRPSGPMLVELKGLRGNVLFRQEIPPN